MKETKKCSLSGLAFTFEDDAYRTLKEYLDSLNRAYRGDPDGTEIIADIEARIAELILSTQDSSRIVERPLVLNIIAQLGTAEAISEESEADDPTTKTAYGEPRIPRRLYRDMENARLGGVCAGLAKYFNVEIPWVRLACCAPLLLIILGSSMPFTHWIERLGGNLFGVAVISYLVMWIAVPAARTARQKLEASGEKITVQSIRDASADTSNNDTDRVAKPVIAETVTVVGHIMIFLLKLFAGLIIFALTLFALALFMGLCILLFSGTENIFGMMGVADGLFMNFNPGNIVAVLGIVAVLIPVFILLYVLASLVLGSKLNRWALLIMFALWIATIIALPVIAIRSSNLPNIHGSYSYSNSEYMDEHKRLEDSIGRAAQEFAVPVTDTVTIVISGDNDSLPSIDRD